MTEMPSYKPKKQYNLYSSFLPILLSIFTYIFFFYVLNVSPSSVFNNTKILFFLSNALIIIIAADYSTFSDKQNHDVYDEYMAATRSEMRENTRPENSDYGISFVEEIKIREKQEEAVEAKDIEKTVRVVKENQPKNIALQKYKPTVEQNLKIGETCNARNLANLKPYGRSKSDKTRKLMTNKERRRQGIKHRPKSYDQSQSDSSKWMVAHEEKKAEEVEEATVKWENVKEESEEFSKMSNEELNRRVEDFIERFNRNIKRQSFV